MTETRPILALDDLTVRLKGRAGRTLIDGLSLALQRGRTMALVGESGSGKTLTALSVMQLLPPAVEIASGGVTLLGRELVGLDDRELCALRGDRMSMIFQEPSTAFNPLMEVGDQVAEVLRLHKALDRRSAREQAVALLEMVGVSDPRRNMRAYTHELSGGLRQRMMIAMALACRPELLIADEPTTALDATVQAQIVDLLARLIRDLRMSVLLITHNLGVVAALADEVAVLHAGRVVESGTVRDVLKTPAHPYTETLLAAAPSLRTPAVASLPASPWSAGAGAVAVPATAPGACLYADRCPLVDEACLAARPALTAIGPGHFIRCFHRQGGR